MTALLTFGYEGQSIISFIKRLKTAGVMEVIDVRELPLSRKKDFSKTAFSVALKKAGIGYNHQPAFGCPRPIRNQYKIDGNWNRYEKAFKKYLMTQKVAVAELADFSKTSTACLVCFEADFSRCHRSFVARAVAEVCGVNVIHLTSTEEIIDQPLPFAA